MHILVTGGAGYIGTHTVVELLNAGYKVTIFDNFSNSNLPVLDRLEKICGKRPGLVQGDVRDRQALRQLFATEQIDGVIHFAGLKSVSESLARPLEYFDNNVRGTLELLMAMREAGVGLMVFSSSATVYGEAKEIPVREDASLQVSNPYGRSKLMVEELLGDLIVAEPQWRIGRLRYFNPVGAHPSGLIGEDPRGVPDNLMPYVAQVAGGRLKELSIYGDDYPTSDGTGVRDFIHVVDLARGHLAALDYLKRTAGLLTVNLGCGRGYSVLELVRAFEGASGRRIPYRIVARRPGDVARSYADVTLAEKLLGWKAELDIDAMCRDTWRWQEHNPCGYAV